MFYVYAFMREDGTPYYIGKGKGNRAFDKRRQWAPKDQSRIKILSYGLTEYMSLLLEQQYIAVYGRKDNNTGILRNLTDGGEGLSGVVRSDSYRNNMRSHFIGVPRSDKTKEKIRKAAANRKGVARTEEVKAKISAAQKGRVFSEEHRLAISKACKGKKRSFQNQPKKNDA